MTRKIRVDRSRGLVNCRVGHDLTVRQLGSGTGTTKAEAVLGD